MLSPHTWPGLKIGGSEITQIDYGIEVECRATSHSLSVSTCRYGIYSAGGRTQVYYVIVKDKLLDIGNVFIGWSNRPPKKFLFYCGHIPLK